jgi:hypothetical protein
VVTPLAEDPQATPPGVDADRLQMSGSGEGRHGPTTSWLALGSTLKSSTLRAGAFTSPFLVSTCVHMSCAAAADALVEDFANVARRAASRGVIGLATAA